jgi:hypothetical protein
MRDARAQRIKKLEFSWKDPGNSWTRGSQILGAKLKLYLGRGGRGVSLFYLENYNLCVIVSGDKL